MKIVISELPTITQDVKALNDVAAEVQRARAKHPQMNSIHEAYAVILEELDEFWDEVKKKSPDRKALSMELNQVAAMCIRARVDCALMDIEVGEDENA